MSAAEERDSLLRLNQAAELIQVRPAYLATEIRRGRLAAYRIGREWRVSRKQLDEWLRMVESRSKVA